MLLYAPYSYFFASIPSFIHHFISNSLIQERFYLCWGPIKIGLSLLLSTLGRSQAQEGSKIQILGRHEAPKPLIRPPPKKYYLTQNITRFRPTAIQLYLNIALKMNLY